MRFSAVSCWALLLIAAASLAQEIQQTYEPATQEVTKYGNGGYGVYGHNQHPSSSFEIGPVNVQTGPQWSVSVFDFINIKQKPNGGVDVVVQPPAILGTANGAKANVVVDDGSRSYHQRRRRRDIALGSFQEQQDGQNGQLINIPYSMQSAGEDERTPKEQTIKIGNMTIKTGKEWSVDFGNAFKIKQKPGGSIDIQFDPPPATSRRGGGTRGKGKGGGAGGGGGGDSGRGGGEDPYDDPSINPQRRRRRALDFWVSKLSPRNTLNNYHLYDIFD